MYALIRAWSGSLVQIFSRIRNLWNCFFQKTVPALKDFVITIEVSDDEALGARDGEDASSSQDLVEEETPKRKRKKKKIDENYDADEEATPKVSHSKSLSIFSSDCDRFFCISGE